MGGHVQHGWGATFNIESCALVRRTLSAVGGAVAADVSSPGDHADTGVLADAANVNEVDSNSIMDPQLEYNMNHASRGLALIFNHEEFHWTLRLNKRRGTQADSNNLELRNLGFTVHVHKDICTTEFHQVILQGYYSHRETVNGSWYIQDLVTALERHGSELELLELLTLVNRMVAARCVDRSNDIKSLGKKQVPCFLSMLTRKLYFRVKQPTNQIA
uniref:Caspase-6 n=1 Tax=Lethenteron reissneri TaxID=7753 RepID=A0A7U0FWT9_LETRI|nr:cysteinyl aspartate specific proteinase 6 [Lethenteron reissneri]